MSFRDDIINEILGIFVILFSFSLAWLLMDYHKFKHSLIDSGDESVIYELKSGSTVYSIADDFLERKWISNKHYFRYFAKDSELTAIKAGEYQIQPQSDIASVLKKFVNGDVYLHKFTIIEGWNYKQLLSALAQYPQVKQTLPEDIKPGELMKKLGKPGIHPEGQFLPDTYAFSRNSTDLDLLKHASESLDSVLNQAWETRQDNLPLKTPYEALVLASIVEKETGVAEERPLIAGVFITRLRKNMKLQTDPTVIYGMGDRFKGNIKRKHLREDTPYDTYVHKGLTPTPISLAGKAAIEAVMNPEEQGYIYFVAKGDGSHQFSKTLKEHNAAVRKYQLKK